MEFKVERRQNPNIPRYREEDYLLAKRFAEELKAELGDFMKAAILFGSAARAAAKPEEGRKQEKEAPWKANDIDVLLLVNDLTMVLSPEVIEAYRIITENTAARISKRLHVTTMKLTSYWDYVRQGDPLIINMLRDGLPLHDVGIFEPAQQLLFQGRIRPSREAVWVYWARAPQTIANSDWHVMQAALDLYWAVIDAAHAALMHTGETPPTPSHVADLIQERLVRKKLATKADAQAMRDFYGLSKAIVHRKLQRMTGTEYDRWRKKADTFIAAMRKVVEKK
jgi:hypothetical protein